MRVSRWTGLRAGGQVPEKFPVVVGGGGRLQGCPVFSIYYNLPFWKVFYWNWCGNGIHIPWDPQGMETPVFINKFIQIWKPIQVYVLKTKGVKVNRRSIHLEKHSCDYLKRKRMTVFTEKKRGIKHWVNKAFRLYFISWIFNFWDTWDRVLLLWGSWSPSTRWRMKGCISHLDRDEIT